VATSLASPVDVKTLAHQSKLCSRSNSRYHLSSHRIMDVIDASTSATNQVRVSFHIRIEPCLTLYKGQFLNQAQLLENMKGLVNRRETDCGVQRFDFSVDPLRGWMISIAKCKSTDRDPLGCCLVSFLTKSLNYGCVGGCVEHLHIYY